MISGTPGRPPLRNWFQQNHSAIALVWTAPAQRRDCWGRATGTAGLGGHLLDPDRNPARGRVRRACQGEQEPPERRARSFGAVTVHPRNRATSPGVLRANRLMTTQLSPARSSSRCAPNSRTTGAPTISSIASFRSKTRSADNARVSRLCSSNPQTGVRYHTVRARRRTARAQIFAGEPTWKVHQPMLETELSSWS